MNKAALELGLLVGKLNSKNITKKEVEKIIKKMETIYSEAIRKIRFDNKKRTALFDINLNKMIDKMFEMVKNDKITKITHLKLLIILAQRNKYNSDITALRSYTHVRIAQHNVVKLMEAYNSDVIKVDASLDKSAYQSPVFNVFYKLGEQNIRNLEKLKKSILEIAENWPESKNDYASRLQTFQVDTNKYHNYITGIDKTEWLPENYDIIEDKVYNMEEVKMFEDEYKMIEHLLITLYTENPNSEVGYSYSKKSVSAKEIISDVDLNKMFLFRSIALSDSYNFENDYLKVVSKITIDIKNDLPRFRNYVLSNMNKWSEDINKIKDEFMIVRTLYTESPKAEKRIAIIQYLIIQLAFMILIDQKYSRKD